MNKKYLAAKIGAIFLSITTVVLFVMSREGLLYRTLGVSGGVTLYMINFALLLAVLPVYIWQRGMKNAVNPMSSISILERVSPSKTSDTTEPVHVSASVFAAISSVNTTDTITLSTLGEFSAFRSGDTVEIVSDETNPASSIRVEFVKIDHVATTLRILAPVHTGDTPHTS